MFCENCGAKLPENEKKCPVCGAVTNPEPTQAAAPQPAPAAAENPQIAPAQAAPQAELAQEFESAVGGKDEPHGFSNKRNIIIIAVAAAVLLAGGIGTAIGINAFNNSAENILSVAQRYLNEKNYEQAIMEFKRVLELDPTNIEAYLGLADAYIAIGDTDNAIDILKKGVEVTGDGRIKRKLDELLKSLEPVQTTATTEQTTDMEITVVTAEPIEEVTVEPDEEPEEETVEAENNYLFDDYECLEIEQMIADYLHNGTEIDESRLENVTRLMIANNGQVYVRCGLRCGTYDDSVYWSDDGTIDDIRADIPFIFNMPSLTELGLCGQPLTDISPLAELTGLTSLDLSWCYGISDISPISELTGLKKLELWCCESIKDITPLESLTELTDLNLGCCVGVTDIAPLSGLTNLIRLDLSFCDSRTDISPLAGLINLEELDFQCCGGLTDISPLSGLTKLSELILWNCDSLSDISVLESLPRLTFLELGECDMLPMDLAESFAAAHPDCEVQY